MSNRSQSLALILILIMAISSLMMTKLAFAQSIPTPSVPQFTIKLVAYPYDVPPIYGIDQYTGKNVTVQAGYHVENKSIEITIRNQPFTSHMDASGNEINIYYNVRVKGHFGQVWKELYSPFEASFRDGPPGSYYKSPVQSSSEYTVLSLSPDYSVGDQVDFQVQAFEGYYTKYYPYVGVSGYAWHFTGELGDWSNTQTFTMTDISTSPSDSPTPTSTPTVSEFPSLLILIGLIGSISVSIITIKRRKAF
jgi:hypothetical protein